MLTFLYLNKWEEGIKRHENGVGFEHVDLFLDLLFTYSPNFQSLKEFIGNLL